LHLQSQQGEKKSAQHTATTLQQHCNNIATALQQHCICNRNNARRRARNTLQQDYNNTATALYLQSQQGEEKSAQHPLLCPPSLPLLRHSPAQALDIDIPRDHRH